MSIALSDDPKVAKVAAVKCLREFQFFTRYFFLQQYKKRFIVAAHHYVIFQALERVFAGECDRLIINIAPRYGKAIDVNTPMLTQRGWIKAKEVTIKDFLIGSNGELTKVKGVFPQGIKKSYKVTFNDFTSLVCCDKHLWEVESRKYKNKFVKTTKEIKNNLYDGDHYKWRIPIVKPLQGVKQKLEIDPYLFGCWLGDGNSYYGGITTMDKEIIDSFNSFGVTKFKNQNSGKAINYGIIGGFVTLLKKINVIGNKHIPEKYLLANYSQRLALLQGLCDTDGTCNKKNFQISISVTNKKLEIDIKKLICSLGGIYRSYYRKNNKSCNISFRIPDAQPFRLQRKLQYCQSLNNKTKPRRIITSITKVKDREMVCFSVAAKDGLFCAGNDLIVTHNTEIAVKQAIAYGLALNAAAKFIHLSYSDDLAKDNSESVKDTIMSAEYQRLFPAVKVKKDSKAKDKWYTTAGGGVLARATGGQVTGFGAGEMETEEEANKRIADEQQEVVEFLADIETTTLTVTDRLKQTITERLIKKLNFKGAIFIDDPIKPEDADSDTKRTNINERFDSTIRNRTNSVKTPIVIICQRTHPEDLIGHLQRQDEPDKWEIISLPSINAETFTWIDRTGTLQTALKGEALWPQKHTLERLQAMEKANALVFGRQYMQNPQPKEGLMFPGEDLHYFDFAAYDSGKRVYCYIPTDPANLGGDDFSTMVGELVGNRIYITDIIYNKNGEDLNSLEVVRKVIQHKADKVAIEGVLGWAEVAKGIRTQLELSGFENEVRILQPRTQKHVRINAKQSFIKNNFYFRSDWQKLPEYAAFMRVLTKYKKIVTAAEKIQDDAPDNCEMMATFYLNEFPDLWPVEIAMLKPD